LLLKIHTHPRGGRRTLESGLQWLAALHRDTDVIVQEPVRDVLGDYVVEVSVPDDAGGSVFCSLVRWIEGERFAGAPSWRECRPVPISPEWAGRLGVMVAKLHRHASQWALPTGFIRPRYGADKMYAWLRRLGAYVRVGRVSAADLALLGRAARRVEEWMIELGERESHWGLIHADLCPDNYVFYQNEVRPLDFDLCGFGHYGLDIGYAFLWQSPGNRRAFLEGYERVRRLPGNYQRVIEAFYIWGVIAMLKFWAPNPELIERTCTRYLRNEPFLFI
jgi:Ser/Thr protein kinase RdoA (MazF antagonist)